MKNIILILLVSTFLFAWVSANNWVSIDNPVMCTMDAKQCSDGSYVGRTGPNCEFTECPWDVEVTPTNPVICTMDAKQCSDGSYVGRTGPNCEFTECPWDVEVTPINPLICTAEAKQCSDGSYVGRTGPNCEFAECPWDVEIIPNDISVYKISNSNENTYTEIKNTVSVKKQRLIDRLVTKFDNKLVDYSDNRKTNVVNAIIDKIETKISDMIVVYQANMLVPENINDKILIFSLLKFELLNLLK